MDKFTSKERYLMMVDYFKQHGEREKLEIKFNNESEDLVNLIDFIQSKFNNVDVISGFLDRIVEFSNENFELILRSSHASTHTLTIEKIVVNPRGKGLGTTIIQEIIEYAKKVGFDRIVLEDVLTDGGIRLAERNGFKTVFKYNMVKEMFTSGPDSYELILSYEFNEIIQVRLKELIRNHNTNGYRIGKYVTENYGIAFQSTLSEIINGKSKLPKMTTIELVMEALDLPLYEFFIDWKFHYYRMKNRYKASTALL